MPRENHECEMVRQSQQQHYVDQDKSTASASRNINKTKKMALAARHGVGNEEDGVHLAGNYHNGAKQDPVGSFDRWPMLPSIRRE